MYSSVVFFLFFFALPQWWTVGRNYLLGSLKRVVVIVGFAIGGILYMRQTPPCCLLPRQPSTSSVCCHPTDWMPVSSCPIGFLSTIFEQFSAILLFAVAGTIFNAICIGIQHFHPSKSDKTSFSGLFSYKGISLWACGWTGVYGFEISLL